MYHSNLKFSINLRFFMWVKIKTQKRRFGLVRCSHHWRSGGKYPRVIYIDQELIRLTADSMVRLVWFLPFNYYIATIANILYLCVNLRSPGNFVNIGYALVTLYRYCQASQKLIEEASRERPHAGYRSSHRVFSEAQVELLTEYFKAATMACFSLTAPRGFT